MPALFAQGSYNKRLDIIADDEIPAAASSGCSTRPTWPPPSGRWAATPASPATSPRRCWPSARPRGRAVRHRPARRVRHGRRLLPPQRSRARRRQGGEPQGHDRDRAQLAGIERAAASAPIRGQRAASALTWMSSAVMLTAISSGVSAPIGRPIGAWTRSSSPASMPSSRKASIVWATFRRLPIMPT